MILLILTAFVVTLFGEPIVKSGVVYSCAPNLHAPILQCGLQNHSNWKNVSQNVEHSENTFYPLVKVFGLSHVQCVSTNLLAVNNHPLFSTPTLVASNDFLVENLAEFTMSFPGEAYLTGPYNTGSSTFQVVPFYCFPVFEKHKARRPEFYFIPCPTFYVFILLFGEYCKRELDQWLTYVRLCRRKDWKELKNYHHKILLEFYIKGNTKYTILVV